MLYLFDSNAFSDLIWDPDALETWMSKYPNAGDHYSRVKHLRQKQGRPMGENDLWIAATARALSATLVTRDQDFDNIDGLPVVTIR
jgi:tRNA(fMet)-specific endonuclease VapC